MIDIDALEGLLNAATPGDWVVHDPMGLSAALPDHPGSYEWLGELFEDANNRLIAALKTAAPDLIAVYRAAQEYIAILDNDNQPGDIIPLPEDMLIEAERDLRRLVSFDTLETER